MPKRSAGTRSSAGSTLDTSPSASAAWRASASSIKACPSSGGGSRPVETWSMPHADMSDSTITFIVLGATVVVFVWDRLPVAVVALGVALSLWATGVLDLDESLGGFGDPTVIFIASLFVVSEGLDASGVTSWAGRELLARVGESRTRLLV